MWAVRHVMYERSAVTPLPAKRRLLNVERLSWAALTVTLAAALAYVALQRPPEPSVVRFQVNPPENGAFGSSSGIGTAQGTAGAALSPDGAQLVFVATRKTGETELWLRRLDSFASRPLAGTTDALMPFWSPDSRSIAFFAGGKLQRVDSTDGTIQTVTEAPGVPRGASWGSGDVIVFSSGTPPQLARVPARGGAVATMSTGPRFPSFLPDGRHFLFSGRRDVEPEFGVMVGSIEPGFESRWLTAADSNAAFAPPGVLLFTRGDRLMQQPFDPDRLQLSGDATPIVEQITVNPGVGLGDFTVSATGVLAFRSTSNRGFQFAWFDRAGTLLETVGRPGNYRTPDLSPDGRYLAFGDITQRDIWILDLARKKASRFTSGSGGETAPVWFPDGNRIAYRKDLEGIFEKDVTGTGAERLLLKGMVNGPDQVSSDGKLLLYFAVTPGGNQDVYVVPTTGDSKPQVIVQTPFAEVEPQLSPDVRWLAYASNENGRNEIYVQAFPSPTRRWQVSTSGGRQPLWRADGKELYFVADDRKFYAVDVSEKSGEFVYGAPQFLFDMPANVFNSRNSYVPSRDGKRFLINMLLTSDDAPINVVQNWRSGSR